MEGGLPVGSVFGIISDSIQWYFLECSVDGAKPTFKLSEPVVVGYGDKDLEAKAKKILGHIVWLLDAVLVREESEGQKKRAKISDK
jgi:hypothetical protein